MGKDYDVVWGQEWGTGMASPGVGMLTRARLIVKTAGPSIRGKVLDVGCGNGFLLAQLARRARPGTQFFGLDVSQKALDLTQAAVGFPVSCLVGDVADKATLPADTYDLVVCSEVLEHIEDDEQAVANLCALVKPGGRLVITVPHRPEYWTAHDDAMYHFRRYERRALGALLERNGLRVVRSFGWGVPLYHLYYRLVLQNVSPQTTLKPKGPLTRVAMKALYYLFFFDDLWANLNKGRILIVLAEREGGRG